MEMTEAPSVTVSPSDSTAGEAAGGGRVRGLMRMGVVPAALYLLCYVLLFGPALRDFSTRFFCDAGDGYQNVFNLWWVNQAISHLHQSPWQTGYLEYPWGVTLLGQTLNPFNGFLYTLLLRGLTLVQAYNTVVIFSFVMAGLTMFWLCHDVTRSYLGSLIGGYVFTFSQFHCGHAWGHLQLTSLEWLPLALLCWRRFLVRPTVPLALGTAAAFFADILCDYYYFFYAVLVAVLMLLWEAGRRRDLLYWGRRPARAPLAAFLAATALTSGALALALVRSNHLDPLTGAHDPLASSTNVVHLFFPSEEWRFSEGLNRVLTRALGERSWFGAGAQHRLAWRPYGTENVVYIGYAAPLVALYAVWAWGRRGRPGGRGEILFWGGLGLLFLLLSLGPALQIGPHTSPRPLGLWMPYAVLGRLLPILNLSGMPLRMIVVTLVALGVLAAAGFGRLLRGRPAARAVAALLLVLLVFETLPRPQITTASAAPGFARFLRSQPPGAFLDTLSLSADDPRYYSSVYDVTLEDKPMAFGYVSRVPASIVSHDAALMAALERRDYAALFHQYHIRYLVTGPNDPSAYLALYREYRTGMRLSETVTPPRNTYQPSAAPLYQDAEAAVYDLAMPTR